MHCCLSAQPCGIAAWRICSAARVERFLYSFDVLGFIEIERWNGVVPLGDLRFLLITGDPVLIVKRDHSSFLQCGKPVLFVAHHTTCAGILRKPNKTFQTEVQYIIACHHNAILIDTKLINRKLNVTNSAQPGLICLGAIIYYSDL